MGEEVTQLDEVRAVLLGQERLAISELSHQVEALRESTATSEQVAELRAEIDELNDGLAKLLAQLHELNALVLTPEGRALAVGEVLVAALEAEESDVGAIGEVLQPEVEHAIHVSARADSVVLAEALYPVMGPALRKMIAELFTPSSAKTRLGGFQVDQVLLIERESGVLLAASPDSLETGDGDVVSGMLDAIRLFVEQAFNSEEHDGLRDLRVGDTSVLVEWGPNALLASVIAGVPTDNYRHSAAATLEQIHREHQTALSDFDGRVEALAGSRVDLDALRSTAQSPARAIRRWLPAAAVLALIILIVVLAVAL